MLLTLALLSASAQGAYYQRRLATPPSCPSGQFWGLAAQTSGTTTVPVTSAAACTAAAKAVDKDFGPAVEETDAAFPAGCYSTGGGLYFNFAVTTKACTAALRCYGEGCQACLSGTYASASGARLACDGTACAKGTAGPAGSTSSGAATCTGCLAGRFAPTAGAVSCDACPQSKFQPAASAPACAVCAAGQSTASAGSTSGADCELSPCPAGRYFGGYALRDSGTCAVKPSSALECTVAALAVGNLEDTAVTETRSDYPHGCYTISDGSSSGVFFNSRSSSAVTCSAGQQCLCGGCVACPGGTSEAASGRRSACAGTPCGAGSAGPTASTSAENATCSACAAGTFAPAGGATGQCEACPAGKWQSAPASGACVASTCVAGRYGSSAVSDDCTDCAAGTFTPDAALGACSACAGGTVNAGRTSCMIEVATSSNLASIVDAAASGTTLRLAAGTYAWTSIDHAGRPAPVKLLNAGRIEIQGAGAGTTVLDAHSSRYFFQIAHSGAELRISDLTLTNGKGNAVGGAFDLSQGTLVLRNCDGESRRRMTSKLLCLLARCQRCLHGRPRAHT